MLVEGVLDMLVDGVLPDAPPRAGVVFVPFFALGTIVAALFGVAAGFLPLRSKSSRSSSQYSSMSKSSKSTSVSISVSGSKSSSSRSSPATSANMRPVINAVSEVHRAVLVSRRTDDCVRLDERSVHEPLPERDSVQEHVRTADRDETVDQHLACLADAPHSSDRLVVVLRRPRRVLADVSSGRGSSGCSLTRKITMWAQVMLSPTVPTEDIRRTRAPSGPASWNLLRITWRCFMLWCPLSTSTLIPASRRT